MQKPLDPLSPRRTVIDGSPRDPTPSVLATMVAITAGWALVKLIANDRRAPAGATSSPIQQGSDFGDKQHADRSAAHEPGRGRRAATPIEIPARGCKDVVWRVYEEFGNDRIMAVAAGVTY